MTFTIGEKYYYQVEYTGKFNSAELLRITAKFCILLTDSGDTIRKGKQNLYATEDSAKLSIIKKIDKTVQEQFSLSIMELSKIFQEMITKYPEKFV